MYMNKKINDYIIEKKRIAQLADDLLIRYQNMRDERSQLHEWEWENEADFTILGLIELYDSDIGGYASQIATEGKVVNPIGAVNVLSERCLFNDDDFTTWYFSDENIYPKIKMYANLLDYLRMLALDYITRYLSDAEVSSPEADSAFSTPLVEQEEKLQAVLT